VAAFAVRFRLYQWKENHLLQEKETPMKHIATVVVFATLFVLGIVPKARAGEHEECSNATLRGSFGYSSTGTLLDTYVPPPYAGPFAEVGRQTFDGKGNTNATATLSANGNIQQVTIQGTYTVNADCTGSMTLYVLPFQSTVHADFVIDDDGAGLRAIGTDSGVVESRVYRKQFREGREQSSKLMPGAGQFLPGLPGLAPAQLSSIFQLRPARAYFASNKTEVC
jgi:hypothetical protein